MNADEGLALHFWASTGIGDDLAITVSNFEFWATFYGRDRDGRCAGLSAARNAPRFE